MPATQPPKYALVTGAGSGLGREFCLQLAKQGWHVCVTDIETHSAEQTLADLQAAGGSGQAEHLDVTDPYAWENLHDKLHQEWPQLDLLINNAGICATGEIGDLPLQQFAKVLDVNFQGVLNGCQTMVPWLKKTAPGGQIVNIASIFGLVAPPTMAAYNSSKAAVVALSETLYGELQPLGIGVTVVAPGFFASQLLNHGHFETDAQQKTAQRFMESAQITAKEVVNQTLIAIKKKRPYVVLGRKARWIWRIKRWLPAPFANAIAWRYRRQLQKTLEAD